jgi:hypothetical protein
LFGSAQLSKEQAFARRELLKAKDAQKHMALFKSQQADMDTAQKQF